MQYNPPLCGNGFTNGPYCNFTPPIHCGGMYPEIIGEGDITSLTLPDGTVQFLFTPIIKWWAPYQCNPNVANLNCNGPYMKSNAGAWIIRSIINPGIPTPYNRPSQRYDLPRPFYVSDCDTIAPNNGFQIKFHNDTCTSTTDIHYFYPSLPHYGCYAKSPPTASTAVQVEIPVVDKVSPCHYEFVCAKPCNCVAKPCYETGESAESKMSITEKRSKVTCKCSSKDLKTRTKNRASSSRERKRASRTKSKIICECEKSPKTAVTDRSITTYADTASDCSPMSGRETQTCCKTTDPPATTKMNGSYVQTGDLCSKTQDDWENISLTKLLELCSSSSNNCSCQSDINY